MMNIHRFHSTILLVLIAAVSMVSIPVSAAEAIRVTNAWARATVPGQKVAGVYMEIVSPIDARLVQVSTPAAAQAEVHSMTMEGGTMKMRAVEALELPSGRPVTLAPGGYHIMLFDVKKPLAAGETVPLTLVIEEKGRRTHKVAVNAVVRAGEHGAGHDSHH